MKYNWGIIGCGHIANEMAEAMKQIDAIFTGIYSRTQKNAEKFAEEYNIKKVYSSVDEMVNDSNIDIIYIATPHNSHIEYLRKALNAGKHILCEKAITLNLEELDEAIEIADKNGLILAEAMTIFHCPVYKQLDKIIASGELGNLVSAESNLGSLKDYDMTNRFFNPNLAGGAMLDIGVYTLSFIRYFMSDLKLTNSTMQKAPSGVDEKVDILLANGNSQTASSKLALNEKYEKRGTVKFENATINVVNYNRTSEIEIIYQRDNKSVQILRDESGISPLAYEVINMEKAVSGEENLMHLDYTRDVMALMTEIRYKHEMYYPEEM